MCPKKKKCYPLSFTILGGCDSNRAVQSSPFQNPGGSLERDGGGQMNEQTNKLTKILVSHIGLNYYSNSLLSYI